MIMKTSNFSVLRTMALLAVGLLALASCQKNNSRSGSSGQHSVQIFLTDDPSFSFDNFFVDIQKVEVKLEDDTVRGGGGGGDDHGGQGGDDNGGHSGNDNGGHSGDDDRDNRGDTAGGWMALDIRPGVYDLLHFRNGLDTVLATGNIATIKQIRKVRLTLGNNNSVVVNGVTTPLVLNGNNNIVVIKLSDDFLDDHPSDIRFTLDLDAGNSVRLHGGQLEFRPRVRPFRRERAGGIEGRVLPPQAQAMVMAFNGTDTATAKPEREGEFKIVGLKAGIYSLLVHPTTGGYKDTTLTNIVVAVREDTHAGTITLRP